MNETSLITMLEHYDIEYKTEGKNIGNCVGVICPFCDDTSFHGGIYADKGRYTCWKCKPSVSLYGYFKECVGLSVEDYTSWVDNEVVFLEDNIENQLNGILNKEVVVAEKAEVLMPEDCVRITQDTKCNCLDLFLDKRGYSLSDCIAHNAYLCFTGKYSYRMILPICMGRELMAYQGVDLTGKASVRYLSNKGDIKQYLYNYYETEYDTMILTEGIFDSWRLKENAVCSFGKMLTNAQISLILKAKPKNIVFAWDADAYWDTIKFASILSSFIPKIKILVIIQET